MKRSMIIILFGLGLFVQGCATKPSYVGSWRCQDMPEKAREAGIVATVMYINEEGSFSGMLEKVDGTPMFSWSGHWETNATGGIDFPVKEGNAPEKGTGQLVDKDTLLGVSGGVALKFIRQ